jgi:concanavalin A-like lectin/glucanase superfamily protein
LSNNTLGSVTVSLLNGDGTTLSTTTTSAASFNLPPTLIPVTGTYPIYIHPNGASSGSITLTVALTTIPSRPVSSLLDSSNSLAANLTGLFVMNEGSGTSDKNLVDSQLASFAGTSQPTWNTTDPSVVFAAGGSLASYLNAGTDLAFDQMPTSQITIVSKIFVASSGAGGLAEKNNASWSGFGLTWDGNGALEFLILRTGANLTAKTANGSVQPGQWIQVAMTWDGTNGTAAAAHFFVNGVEQTKVSSVTGSGSIDYSGATSQPFRIGNSYFRGAMNGKMAYLAVYRGRILTSAEMSQLDAQLPIH